MQSREERFNTSLPVFSQGQPMAGGYSPTMTDAERQTIIHLYETGLSTQKIADQINRSKPGCLKVLRDAGVSRRRVGHPRTCAVDETFFDTIDTEEKAYFLGLIAADGNVVAKQGAVHVLRICLLAKDIDIIEKFKAALQSEHKLKIWTRAKDGHTFARIGITSKCLVEALAKYTIVPAKTWTVEPPDAQIPDDLLKHYWRGYFDGDGCITGSMHKNNRYEWYVYVVGNHQMMVGFYTWMSQHVPQLRPPWEIKNGVFRVGCGGTAKPKLFVQALYIDSRVHLDRKKQLADRLMQVRVLRKTAAYN